MEKEKQVEVKVAESKDVKTDKFANRDFSIDLIRILACISVLATHLCLQAYNVYWSQVDWSRIFEKCFLTDNVTLFFMITGFFLVNGRSYLKIWKSTIFKVLIPTLVYVLVAQVFVMFILNKETFSWCIQNAITNLNIQGIFRTIITGDLTHVNTLCDHLWYIFSYVKIIIWVPILWLLFKEDKVAILARRILIAFTVVSAIITDIQRFYVLPVGRIASFELISRELIYVIIGYELFIRRDKIKGNKKAFFIGMLGFVLVNILRYKLENMYMVINNYYEIYGRENFIEWNYNSLAFFSSTFFFVAVYSLPITKMWFKKVLVWLSDKTFGIYLVHYMLIAKVDLYKFDKLGYLYQELIYLFVSIIVTFTASTLIVWIIKLIKKLIKKCFCKLVPKKGVA